MATSPFVELTTCTEPWRWGPSFATKRRGGFDLFSLLYHGLLGVIGLSLRFALGLLDGRESPLATDDDEDESS